MFSEVKNTLCLCLIIGSVGVADLQKVLYEHALRNIVTPGANDSLSEEFRDKCNSTFVISLTEHISSDSTSTVEISSSTAASETTTDTYATTERDVRMETSTGTGHTVPNYEDGHTEETVEPYYTTEFAQYQAKNNDTSPGKSSQSKNTALIVIGTIVATLALGGAVYYAVHYYLTVLKSGVYRVSDNC